MELIEYNLVEVGSDLYNDHLAALGKLFPLLGQFSEERLHKVIQYLTGGFDVPEKYNNYYKDPASTKETYHGCFEGGLIAHSLYVYYYCLKLAPIMGVKQIDPIACLFHDLCKVNSYKDPWKNAYNDFNTQAKTWKEGNIGIVHGPESLRRLANLGVVLNTEAWQFAVALHMGGFDQGESLIKYAEGCKVYHEVLLLHTADMCASSIENV